MTKFRPMLAATYTGEHPLTFPLAVSNKLDGIRCLKKDGTVVSRTLKPIPNEYIQECLKDIPDGFDGELIVGSPTAKDVWNKTSSGVMSQKGEPDFTYYVFDLFDIADTPFVQRTAELIRRVDSLDINKPVTCVPHKFVHDEEELNSVEVTAVLRGYEGIMLRDPFGKYKFGRSTEKQGWLLKVKRWFDAEYTVTGAVEQMQNNNEATTNALGLTERAHRKGNKTGKNMLGALLVTNALGQEFQVGTGFTEEERISLWKEKESLTGKLITVEYQQLTETETPRFPVFKGFRDYIDVN